MKKLDRSLLRKMIIKEAGRWTSGRTRASIGNPYKFGNIQTVGKRGNHPDFYVYFCARQLFGLPIYHSWIVVGYKDSNGKPKQLTLSGKSGAEFTADRFLSLNINKIWNWSPKNPIPYEIFEFGRDEDPDNIWRRARKSYERLKSEDRYGTSQEFKDAVDELERTLKDTTWRNLQKRKNWSSDSISNATIKKKVFPPPGMQMNAFVHRIISAYEGYAENIPYDPAPEISENTEDRNSNSFAFSLLRTAYGGKLPPNIKIDTVKFPGSSKNINMIAPNMNLKLPI